MAADRLKGVFAEVLGLPPDQVSDATSPDTTSEWDSLAAMNLVAALEETFGVELSTTEIMRMRSVGIVREVLRAKGVADV
jgi:acyl carrier protein